MYNFNTAIGSFTLPSNYSEITISDLNFILSNLDNEIEVLKRLTGFDEVKLSMLDLSEIGNFFEFLKQPLNEIEPLDFVGDFDLSFDLREKTFGQKIKASQHLVDNEPLEMLAVYCECEVSYFDLLSVSEVYSAVNYIAEQLRLIDEDKHKMLHFAPTMEQIMAGIDKFDELGEFNTIDTLALKYNYTHKQVEELEYNVVLLILYRSKIQANFEAKLTEIVRQKQ